MYTQDVARRESAAVSRRETAVTGQWGEKDSKYGKLAPSPQELRAAAAGEGGRKKGYRETPGC
jgi:hypothetical protein